MNRIFTLFCCIIAFAFGSGAHALWNAHFSFLRGVGFVFCVSGFLVYALLAVMYALDSRKSNKHPDVSERAMA